MPPRLEPPSRCLGVCLRECCGEVEAAFPISKYDPHVVLPSVSTLERYKLCWVSRQPTRH